MDAPKPRLVLADDHALVLDAYACVLAEEFAIVATASDGDALLRLAAEHRPDVVVVDLSMPGPPMLEVVRVLASRHPDTRILILTRHAELQYARAAFGAGAHGYIIKGSNPQRLIEAVWSVLRGRRAASAELWFLLEPQATRHVRGERQ